ncbi:MAG: hypothetical protein KGK08_04620 [Acidobacteriota bacterium]|nr:hypothetical protein [Acidobacteriota bacterium]
MSTTGQGGTTMELEKNEGWNAELLGATAERLSAAAGLLERAVQELVERQNLLAESTEASLGRLVATVESRRETELEQKLTAMEAELAAVRASVTVPVAHGRKTQAAVPGLQAKDAVGAAGVEMGALDAALSSLSMEQRFAVKAQLLRAGLVG